MKASKILCILCVCILIISSCNSNDEQPVDSSKPSLKSENILYKIDSIDMDGYIVFDENQEGKRPAVLVVHEWWGLNEYTKSRARQLAMLGYVAIAVDLYGDGQRAVDPTEAMRLATPFYKDPALAQARLEAALYQLKTYKEVDTNRIAAIGYCFGGGMLLNLARMGAPLKGVVSFHGSLLGTPAHKNLLQSKILVCHGEADSFVPPAEVEAFKKQMDSIGASYTFKSYPGATHAFTNPGATQTGKQFNIPIAYNAAADTASWKEMKLFLSDLFK